MTFTSADFQKALTFTLHYEGGYCNVPGDTGGETNCGITHAVYDTYRKSKKLPVRSVRLIEKVEIEDIYKNRYWQPAGCHLLPEKLAMCHFDWAVNHGVVGATQTLQRVIGVSDDGIIGDLTKQAITRALANQGEKSLCATYCLSRENWYRHRVMSVPSQQKFLEGWLNRVSALKKLTVV